jgi:signal transduction histidine kinase
MTFFMGILGYIIVKFEAFNIRLIGAQALVVALIILIGSMFAFVDTMAQRILVGTTLVFTSSIGWLLIQSMKKEIRRKEELQEIATKLAVANEELRRLDNTKSEFISIASHQLRTPLTAIKGFLSLVLEGSYGKLSAEVEDVLNKVYSANNHLVDLVENLLNISRIESGRIQYQFVPTEIEGIVRELADAFSVVAKGRKINLAFVYPEVPVPPFLMDAQKIREVISNMIDNAIKYTQEGGITVRLTSDDEKVRISVKDTGVGIAPEDLPILFQKFRRGKESGKVNVSGTGLGLYVGKSFAEAHGGRMTIESEGVGKGSTFTLELPFRTEKGLGKPKAD